MNTITKHLPTAARIFLGLVFTVFGLNFFLHFIPQPPAPPQADAFVGALTASGYLMPLLKTSEVLAGLLLLRNRFVPLALTVLAPIVVNIVGFHLALAPGGLALLTDTDRYSARPLRWLLDQEELAVAVTPMKAGPPGNVQKGFLYRITHRV